MKNVLVICAILMGVGALTMVASVASAMEAHRMNRLEPSMRPFFLGVAMLSGGFFGGVVALVMEYA